MKMYMTQPEAKRTLAAEQTHSDLHPGQGVITMPTHDEIAMRAYYIYLQSDRREGQCEKNWRQAEYDLRTGSPRLSFPGYGRQSDRQD
jgi:hypothetical protein